MRVSIGLPVFNGERYLAQAIKAHLAQDFGDFELVIFDNASTDRTKEICHGFAAADGRIRIVSSDRNRGVNWNHVRAFQETRAPYFRWAAADDLPSPDFLSEAVSLLDENSDVVACVPRTINIDEESKQVAENKRTLHLRETSAVARAKAVLTRTYQQVFAQGLLRRQALMATRRKWDYVGWDFILLLELALLGQLAQTERGILYRRFHSGQAHRAMRSSRSGMESVEPGSSVRFSFPHWLWERERTRAILRGPISPADKLALSVFMLRHAWWNRTLLWGDIRSFVARSTGNPENVNF